MEEAGGLYEEQQRQHPPVALGLEHKFLHWAGNWIPPLRRFAERRVERIYEEHRAALAQSLGSFGRIFEEERKEPKLRGKSDKQIFEALNRELTKRKNAYEGAGTKFTDAYKDAFDNAFKPGNNVNERIASLQKLQNYLEETHGALMEHAEKLARTRQVLENARNALNERVALLESLQEMLNKYGHDDLKARAGKFFEQVESARSLGYQTELLPSVATYRELEGKLDKLNAVGKIREIANLAREPKEKKKKKAA